MDETVLPGSIADVDPALAERFTDDSPTPPGLAYPGSGRGWKQRVKVRCADCGEPREISAYAAAMSSSCRRCRSSKNVTSANPRGSYAVSAKPLRYEKSIAFKYPELASLFCDDSPTPPEEAAYSTQRGMRQRVKVLCSACGKPKEVSAYAAVMAKDAGCRSCQIPSAPLPTGSTASKGEDELADYVESLGHTVIRRNRTLLGGKELDIYLPELKLALEFNGDYWHSDEWLLSRGNITAEEYHRTKLELAAERGVRLGFVWSSEWRFKWSRKPILEAVAEFLATDETPPSLLRLTSPSPKFASIPPSDEPESDCSPV